jgi:hypothetical protein
MTDDYAKRRLAELHAAAPAKRKKIKPFALIELDVAAKAFAAASCPKAMVWVWLVHQARKVGKKTVAVPNGALAKYGVDRKTKYLALRQYEAVGLLTVEWRARKTPVATLR